MKKWELSRRAVIRGLGATIALPFLEAMEPWMLRNEARAATAKAIRSVYLYISCGVHQPSWNPTGSGVDYVIPPHLQSVLNPYKSNFQWIKGLNGGPSDTLPHPTEMPGWLSCYQIAEDESAICAVSADQLIANTYNTKVPSLTLMPTGYRGHEGTGHHNAIFFNVISWYNNTTPAPRTSSPQQVFNTLFSSGNTNTNTSAAAQVASETSILDFTSGQINKLNQLVGKTDAQRLDQYLTAIRAVEKTIASSSTSSTCTPPAQPASNLSDQAQMKAMMDMIVLAFQCDLTRVVSYILEFSAWDDPRSITVPGGTSGLAYHTSSHYNSIGQVAAYQNWTAYYASQFAYLMGKLKALPDAGGGTLLDNSIILWGGGQGDGDGHSYTNLPCLLGGGGGGVLHPGRMINVNGARTANLHRGIFELMGLTGPQFTGFADNNGSLASML